MPPAFAVWSTRCAHGIFAFSYFAKSNGPVSSDALKRVLGVSPESAEAALRLAHDHLDAARYGQAVAAALAALKLHPGSADGWLVLGIASRYLSAYDKAETALAEALKRAPLFAEAVKELAMV